ncbi:g357 [Yersinia phage phiR1-37]|uniref:hypothetical protein n=1 Tax=Yersinia phage phiR1-37 TaxID=331278 RepID=UPI00022DBE10|nr:hypothetical protein phiR1-37_gp357 [Yersinia phage phiR1-37]CCE26380.1 g357 [Yersinia phage phiR1-37]
MKTYKYPLYLLPTPYTMISATLFFNTPKTYDNIVKFIKTEGKFSSIIKINENHNVHITFKWKRVFFNENS